LLTIYFHKLCEWWPFQKMLKYLLLSIPTIIHDTLIPFFQKEIRYKISKSADFCIIESTIIYRITFFNCLKLKCKRTCIISQRKNIDTCKNCFKNKSWLTTASIHDKQAYLSVAQPEVHIFSNNLLHDFYLT
jgi:hypothetical protein